MRSDPVRRSCTVDVVQQDQTGAGGRLRFRRPPWDRETFAAAAARLAALTEPTGVSAAHLCTRLRSGRSPRVAELIALSRNAGLPFYDVLLACGHDAEDIPGLTAELHRDRTVPLPTVVHDPARLIEWPDGDDTGRSEFLPDVTTFTTRRAAHLGRHASPLRFFRIGRGDGAAFPTIVPGTIVAVDTRHRLPEPLRAATPPRRRSLYVVATVRGLTCAWVEWMSAGRIAVLPETELAAPSIYALDTEAAVIGRVCAELRPMQFAPPGMKRGRDHAASRLRRPDPCTQPFGRFLRAAREALGLTHREAHAITGRISAIYDDRRFTIGVGTLSDWEAQEQLPLHLTHLFSLAVCYAVTLTDLLAASRTIASDPFRAVGPDEEMPGAPVTSAICPSLFPPALHEAARVHAGLPAFSWDAIFRCGPGIRPLDRALEGAAFLVVDRRHRRLDDSLPAPSGERTLHLLTDECGRHLCCACFADRRTLFITPDPQLCLPIRAVPRDAVTIRGRVAAIFRTR